MSKILVDRKVLEQALEALETARDTTYSDTLYVQFEQAITALHATLEQSEQEPAFWGFINENECRVDMCFSPSTPRTDGTYATAYYTHHPHRD
jgi:hypothetical protein